MPQLKNVDAPSSKPSSDEKFSRIKSKIQNALTILEDEVQHSRESLSGMGSMYLRSMDDLSYMKKAHSTTSPQHSNSKTSNTTLLGSHVSVGADRLDENFPKKEEIKHSHVAHKSLSSATSSVDNLNKLKQKLYTAFNEEDQVLSKNEAEVLKIEVEDMKKRMSLMASQNRRLQDEATLWQERHDSMDVEEKFGDLVQDLDNTARIIQEKSVIIQELSSERHSNLESLTELRKTNSTLVDQNIDLLAKYWRLKQALNERDDEMARSTQEVQKLLQTVKSKDEDYHEFENRAMFAEAQVKVLWAKVQKIENDFEPRKAAMWHPLRP